MTRPMAYLVALLTLSLGMGAEHTCTAQAKAQGKAAPRAQVHLPASLDALFPPKSDQPVLLMRMHAMNTALVGVAVDFLENDLSNSRDNFENFKTQYLQLSKLVPEWTKNFPRDPVDQLGKALSSGDQGKVMGAIQNVGRVCENCHVQNMVPVQQKYHWPNFHDVSISDPVTNQSMDYAEFMHFLNIGLTGMGVDLRQGQQENALKHYEQFRTRMATLRETCIACHDTERKYYVDPSVMALVDTLGMVVKNSPADAKRIEQLSMAVGTESCFKCHLVHLPAAHAKHRMNASAASAHH